MIIYILRLSIMYIICITDDLLESLHEVLKEFEKNDFLTKKKEAKHIDRPRFLTTVKNLGEDKNKDKCKKLLKLIYKDSQRFSIKNIRILDRDIESVLEENEVRQLEVYFPDSREFYIETYKIEVEDFFNEMDGFIFVDVVGGYSRRFYQPEDPVGFEGGRYGYLNDTVSFKER